MPGRQLVLNCETVRPSILSRSMRNFARPFNVLLLLASSALAAIAGCGSDAIPAEPLRDSGTMPDAYTSENDASVDAAVPDALPDTPTSQGLKIHFDYRFDTKGFFSDAKRRAALEGAARIWRSRIKSTFPNVPSGTYVFIRNPEQPDLPSQGFNLDYEIDDLVVFVGAAELGGARAGRGGVSVGLSGVSDTQLRETLSARYNLAPFRPWTGWISFDETMPWHFDATPDSSDVPPTDKTDFISIALHELGHVLGFSGTPPFVALVSGDTFVGPKAVSVYGGPVPLASSASHFPDDIFGGTKRPVMSVSSLRGQRALPSPLDIAVFEDLGYTF